MSEQLEQSNEEVEVEDPAEQENDETTNAKYEITSYGADYTIDGLVKRLDNNDIIIPEFQRQYVWNINQASRFIESLLLGLPVPGIFLNKEENKRLAVIDGQQRLRTLQYFYAEKWGEDKEFALSGVRSDFAGRTYSTLTIEDKRQLDDAILHATIIQQNSPDDDDSSIYHIFERLNTGGVRLQPQEIRASVYHGAFINLLKELNDYPAWRKIYGKKDKRRKDEELILRFLAMYFMGSSYQKPLTEFLNKFAYIHQTLKHAESPILADTFKRTIDVFQSIGRSAFRRFGRVINVAVFESMMVGVARRLEHGPIYDMEQLKQIHDNLLQNRSFINLYTFATTDEAMVKNRIALATEAFLELK